MFSQVMFNAMLIILANAVVYQVDLDQMVQLINYQFLDFIHLVMRHIARIDIDLVSHLASQDTTVTH